MTGSGIKLRCNALHMFLYSTNMDSTKERKKKICAMCDGKDPLNIQYNTGTPSIPAYSPHFINQHQMICRNPAAESHLPSSRGGSAPTSDQD